jgi:phytoene synthase
MLVDVEQAYSEVERLTRARAKNFGYGIMVLPRPKRRAIAAIYAFAREVDDVADGTLPLEEKRARLEALRASLGREPATPMEIALADARARFPIPRPALEALVEGGLQDTEQSRYATIDELLEYCRKVAGALGVACIGVYGSDDVEHAEQMGLALQLINVMRDVREDWHLDRVYLPQDELVRHRVSEDDIAAGRQLLPSLDRRSRLCVATFAGIYEGQLDRIERNDYDVFERSCRLPVTAKFAVVARGLLG